MRALRLLVLLLPLVLLGLPATGSSAAAAKPRLVVKKASATVVGTQLTVSAKVKNKARTKARPGELTVYLSQQVVGNSTGFTLGTIATPRIKAGRAKTVEAQLALPAGRAGSWRMSVCTTEVRCANAGDITIPVRITAGPAAGGTVSVTGLSGGTCSAGVTTTCTFTPGTGSVTFTPKPAADQRFDDWTGCTGFTRDFGGVITFTAPTVDASCTATFAPAAYVSWSTKGSGTVKTTVSSSGLAGCYEQSPTTGYCVTDPGNGKITMTATPASGWLFVGWAPAPGATCSVSAANPAVINGPVGTQACVAQFVFD